MIERGTRVRHREGFLVPATEWGGERDLWFPRLCVGEVVSQSHAADHFIVRWSHPDHPSRSDFVYAFPADMVELLRTDGPEPREVVIPIGTADGTRSSIAATLRRIADDVETCRADGVAVVVVLRDRAIGTMVYFADEREAPFSMLGGIEYVKTRLLGRIEGA
jgi:hypothetical protein